MATSQSHSGVARRGQFVATVLANDALCDEHFLLRLHVPGLLPTRPGQFVQLQCRHMNDQVDLRETSWPPDQPPRLSQPELTNREPFLRRPISLAGRRDVPGGGELELIYRTVGTGTHWLARELKTGDRLNVLGPLGNGFAISNTKPLAALIGGGVGIPPMLYLAEALARAGKTAVAFNGVRTARLLPLKLTSELPCSDGTPALCTEGFARNGVKSVIATDDGSLGYHGMVGKAFEKWLDESRIDPSQLVVYSCGPERMMQAVAQICLARDIDCQLALERHMACGMGTCQSCICKMRSEGPRAWAFKLVCTDGPVFSARNILW